MEMWALEFNTVWNVVHCYPFEIRSSSVILSCWHSLNCCTFIVWCSEWIICIAVEAQARHGERITGICAVVMVVCYKREEICVCACTHVHYYQTFLSFVAWIVLFHGGEILYILLNRFLQFVAWMVMFNVSVHIVLKLRLHVEWVACTVQKKKVHSKQGCLILDHQQ